MSLPEILLWRVLRQRPGGYKFRKQFPLHPHVIDFACLKARLAIEVDGEAHNRGNRPQRDLQRDAMLDQRGFATLRIPASYVLKNLDGAIVAITTICRERASLDDRPARPDEE